MENTYRGSVRLERALIDEAGAVVLPTQFSVHLSAQQISIVNSRKFQGTESCGTVLTLETKTKES
jgi:hypothetical protein